MQAHFACPECGTDIVSSCKCPRRHGQCQNGHSLAYCTEHYIFKVLPQGLDAHMLGSNACVCTTIKQFEAFRPAVEYWEKQLADKGVHPYDVLSVNCREKFVDVDSDLLNKMKGVYVRDIHHPRDDIVLTDGCEHDLFELNVIRVRCGLESQSHSKTPWNSYKDVKKWEIERAIWIENKTVTISVKHYEALLQSQKALSTIEKKLENIQQLAEGLRNEHNKRPRLDDVQ